MESDGGKEVLKRLCEVAEDKIRHAISWSYEHRLVESDWSPARVAAIVLFHEGVFPFSGTIGEAMVGAVPAEETDIAAWIKESFRFTEDAVYDFFCACKSRGYAPKPFDLKSLDKEYGVVHSAAAEGDEGMVGFILSQGVDVNSRDEEGKTPLHAAASGGHDGTVSYLLQRGASVLAADDRGNTPFDSAFDKGHFSTADLLSPRIFLCNDRTSFRLLKAFREHSLKKIEYILKISGDSCFPDDLYLAAEEGLASVVEWILTKNQCNYAMHFDHEPLAIAINNGHADVVEKLLSFGIRPKFGLTELVHECEDPDVLKVLMKFKTNDNLP